MLSKSKFQQTIYVFVMDFIEQSFLESLFDLLGYGFWCVQSGLRKNKLIISGLNAKWYF